MKHQILSLLLFVLFALLATALPVAAQQTVFSEDFSGDLSQWQPLRDDGRYWKIQDGALEAMIPLSFTISELIPTDNAWNDADSYVIDLEYTALNGADRNIAFGVTDKDNWYEAHFNPSGTQLVKVKHGTVIWQESSSYIMPTGIPLHISVVFIKGGIQVFVNGTQIITTTDPTFVKSEGKLTVKAGTGGIFPTKVKIDNILVRKIETEPQVEGTQLGVELLKQDDNRWANLEYDTATIWATSTNASKTIKDWGCNLLSQLMILQYHDITKLPDGSELTPITLNKWLLENKGFYSNPPSGNINRQSISTLTAEINKEFNTPKLEFLYVDNNLIPIAVAEIEKGNPVILELEGHFVVADGFTEDKTDLYIKDPSYSVTKLSEHPLPLKSVRLFTPSYTDLSYITVTSSEQLQTKIFYDQTEVPLTQYKERTRLFSEENTASFSPSTFITDISKPADGTYALSITNPTPVTQLVTLTTYTADGESQQFTVKAKKGASEHTLRYKKNGKSTLNQKTKDQLSYKNLQKTIRVLSDTNQIKQAYFEKALLQLIKPAEKLTTSNQRKLLKIVKTVVKNAPKTWVTKPAKALLLEQIGLILANLK